MRSVAGPKGAAATHALTDTKAPKRATLYKYSTLAVSCVTHETAMCDTPPCTSTWRESIAKSTYKVDLQATFIIWSRNAKNRFAGSGFVKKSAKLSTVFT